MGVSVLVIGASGSGKSRSIKNMPPEEIGVFNISGKLFPFREQVPAANICRAADIKDQLKKGSRKCYILDDAQFIMSFQEMDTKKTGFDKWNAIGYDFIGLVRFVNEQLPADTTVYFLMHSEVTDDGCTKAKTLGKLIDAHYTLEGLAPVVIGCEIVQGKHKFVLHNKGATTYKTPEGMFEQDEIENDLVLVDDAIRDYWHLGSRKTKSTNKAKEVEK